MSKVTGTQGSDIVGASLKNTQETAGLGQKLFEKAVGAGIGKATGGGKGKEEASPKDKQDLGVVGNLIAKNASPAAKKTQGS
jgi:hypothetical protein